MHTKTAIIGLATMAFAGPAAAAVPNMYLVQADHDTMTVLDRGSMVQVAPTIRRVEVHTFY